MPNLSIADLQRYCDERVEESLTLEFKPCNEIRKDSPFRRNGQPSTRTTEDIADELSRDVSAFLNAAGGTLIYGIQQTKGRSSRAKELDRTHSFRPGDSVTPEYVLQLIRAHIQPSPTVNAYSVSDDPTNAASAWYIVIEIPQGQQAYMARDHRFYKRIGNIVQSMEQYEVVDAMNRTKGAELLMKLDALTWKLEPGKNKIGLRLRIELTSGNFIASEYGAVKLTFTRPAAISMSTLDVFPGAQIEREIALPLGQDTENPIAQSLLIRWGAHNGNVIFPGNWHNFYGNSLTLEVPSVVRIPTPTYLLQTELFTVNSLSKKALYALRQLSDEGKVEIPEVTPENRGTILEEFWRTYHAARQNPLT